MHNTHLWVCINVSYMNSLFLKIFFQATIDHKWKYEVGVSIWCVKAHSSQTQDVGVVEVFHYQTLSKELV